MGHTLHSSVALECMKEVSHYVLDNDKNYIIQVM